MLSGSWLPVTVNTKRALLVTGFGYGYTLLMVEAFTTSNFT